jgi:hypothetical protein
MYNFEKRAVNGPILTPKTAPNASRVADGAGLQAELEFIGGHQQEK